MGPEYDYRATDSVYNLRVDSFPEFVPNFQNIVLQNGAVATDLLSSTPVKWFVFLVSNKLRDIVTNFKLPPHKIYSNVPVLHNGEVLENYSALHFLQTPEYLQYIDFERSRFWIVDLISKKKIVEVNARSISDLEEAENQARQMPETSLVWAEDLSVNDAYFDRYDFLSSAYASPLAFYTTETVKQAVEKAGSTGIEFYPVSENKEVLVSYLSTEQDQTFFPVSE